MPAAFAKAPAPKVYSQHPCEPLAEPVPAVVPSQSVLDNRVFEITTLSAVLQYP